MNKLIKLLTLSSVFTLSVVVTSCVTGDDFDLPDTIVAPVDVASLGTETNFSAVVSRYLSAVADGDDIGVFTDEFDDPLYIVGYVVSSDRAGNFFEEIIIQNSIDGNDAGNDSRRGLKVEIDARSLSDYFDFGRKVYIKLNGLAIGEENGVYTLGKAVGNSLTQIPESEFQYRLDPNTGNYRGFIARDPEVATILPKVVAIGDLTEMDENTLVQFEDVQINRNELGLTFAGEPSDQFDGFRTLESCADNSTMTLQTSTFADFKSVPLPENRGSITGILTRDFGDDFNVFVINSRADINFDNEERCDPDILECDGPTSNMVTIFEEDFQSITNESQLDGMGWTNVNVSGGSERYEDSSFSGDTYMKISAFGTGENPLEAWLVTPAINLDATTQEELSVDISANFETGRILSAFITNEFTGDVTTTVWTQLDIEIPIGGSGFGDFVTLTTNISCLDGDVHVAFKYLGAAGGAETRYHIDDIIVTGM